MTQENSSNGNGTKTDIQWIKDTLKEHGETLKRIESRLDENAERCRDRHAVIDRELAALSVRAGLYGALAGAVPALLATIAWLIKAL